MRASFPRRTAFCFSVATVLLLSMATGHCQEAKIRILNPQGKYVVMLGQALFAEIDISQYAKPIVYPILGPDQTPMTRNYPMQKGVAGEAVDHPHHKAIWCGHGDINGVSFWHEEGKMVVDPAKPMQVAVADDGSDGSVSFHCNYLAPDGKLVCTDDTKISFRQLPCGSRAIDWQVSIHASESDLKFGDTKEGTMAIRTHPSLRVDNDEKAGVTSANGKAVNSEGGEGGGIWGKHAAWVDYSGNVEGKHVGIAIFDHPSNLRHPTTWHARKYGLVAANPFGLSHFEGKPKGTGDHFVKQGDSLEMRYRFVFHKGDAEDAKLDELFRSYSSEDSSQP